MSESKPDPRTDAEYLGEALRAATGMRKGDGFRYIPSEWWGDFIASVQRIFAISLREAELEAENMRLREALKYIGNIGSQLDEPDKPIDPASRLVRAVMRANIALKEEA